MIRLKDILLEAEEQKTGAMWLDRVKDIITIKSNFKKSIKDIQNGNISQTLLDDVETAVRNTSSVTSIQIGSTLRPGDPKRHGRGLAVDIPVINGVNFQDKAHAKETGVYKAHQELVATFVKMGYKLNSERGHEKAILEFDFDNDHRHHIHLSNTTETPSPISSKPDDINKPIDDISQEKPQPEEKPEDIIEINKSLKTVDKLKYGNKGTAVEELQIKLAELEYYLGDPETGEVSIKLYGIHTRSAIKLFQREVFESSNKWTGIADKETINKLLIIKKDQKEYIIQSNKGHADVPTDLTTIIKTPKEYKLKLDHVDIKQTIAPENNGTTLIIFGGSPNNKYGPEYLLNNMPDFIKQKKNIIYVQGDKKNWTIKRVRRYIKSDTKIDSIIGFSSGVKHILPELDNSNYDFIGLIDPIIPKKYSNIILHNNVYMWAKPENFTGKFSEFGDRIKTIMSINSNKNIYQHYNHSTEMLPRFLSAHKYQIL